jgi:predicted DNA-binding transcriptional regulator YafY
MEFIKLNNYINQLDSLIRQECTGTANEFAKKIGVSERTLQNHLQQLRELGIDVVYDHCKRSYRYNKKGRLTFCFTPYEMSEIKGGHGFLKHHYPEVLLIN